MAVLYVLEQIWKTYVFASNSLIQNLMLSNDSKP